jgi:hypothetical protein
MQLRHLALPLRSLAAIALLAATSVAQGTATVRGTVSILGKGTKIVGVTVVAADSNDVRTTTRTDSAGTFRMRVRAPGKYQLAILQVGQMPTIGPMIEVIPEDTIDANLQIPFVVADTVAQLNEVRVVDERVMVPPRLADFERRRTLGLSTRSITREEIEKRNPTDTWQMLANVPSMKIAQQGSVVIARSMRVESPRLTAGTDMVCYMRVMVDGVLMQEDMLEAPDFAPSPSHPRPPQKGYATDLTKTLPRPNEIHGIEVFAGPASIPPQYGGTGSNKWCGLIAVWTK